MSWKDTLIEVDLEHEAASNPTPLCAAALRIAAVIGSYRTRDELLAEAGWLIRHERKRLDPKGMTVRWDLHHLHIPDDETFELWEALRCVAVAAQQDDSEPYNAAISLRRAEACLRQYWKATR